MVEAQDIDHWVKPRQVFTEGNLRDGMAVGLSKGRIAALVPVADLPASAAVAQLDGILSPGFVDLQVNGGGGVLLNAKPTPDAMRQIAQAHRAFGTTAILPTVISDTAEVIDKAVDAAITAHGRHGVSGLHIEGPHISVDRRGTHKAAFLRPIDARSFDQVARLRDAGVPTLMTLAPDVVAPEDIRRLVDLGAVISLGHTKASSDEVKAALDAGAACFTHLFNAMPPMAGRTPGVVGAAINSTAFVGIICDGIHVADEMVALAIRARPERDRMFLVSDAMPTVGGPSEFDLYGTKVHLIDNRLVNSEGSLAGAHTTQAAGVARLVQKVGLSPQDALRMAISVPAQAMGLSLDRLIGARAEDVLCLTPALDLSGFLSDALELCN